MDRDALTSDSYTIAWVCALPIELSAAQAVLDERHPQLPSAKGDTNIYRLGRIFNHNVVIVMLELAGSVPAAVAAAHLLRTFPKIRFGLMVGIGGGAPAVEPSGDTSRDIHLGDVVVSMPRGLYGGVIQYDYGKTIANGKFEYTSHLNNPPRILSSAVKAMESDAYLYGYRLSELVSELLNKFPEAEFHYPGAASDLLFTSSYTHVSGKEDCSCCEKNELVQRKARTHPEEPKVHFGLIGSANQVVRDSTLRNKLREELGIICFEMEAAGLMNDFPCIVIRGICDYSDSHKNKEFQPYAAITAAAYARKLLSTIAPMDVADQKLAQEALASLQEIMLLAKDLRKTAADTQDRIIFHRLSEVDGAWFNSSQSLSHDERENMVCLPGTQTVALDHIRQWLKNTSGEPILWLSGAPGTGKSTIARTIATESANLGRLAASYFFRKGLEFNDGSRFSTTLAAQLARHSPAVRSHIKRVIEDDVFISQKDLKEQFQKLILEPLLIYQGSLTSPLILVVDALDECDGNIELITQLFSQMVQIKDADIRILISSRPEHVIHHAFRRIPSSSFKNSALDSISTKILRNDLRIYFRHKLQQIVRDNGHLEKKWPGKETIDRLARIAHPFYTIATTICRYIADPSFDPETQLEDLLRNPSMYLSGIDGLYTTVLSRMLPEGSTRQAKFLQEFKAIIGAVLYIKEPLNVKALASLLGMRDVQVSQRLQGLYSVLCVPTDHEQPISVRHESFKDFLTNPERKETHRFWIDEQDVHSHLAQRCLEILNQSDSLKQNICDLENVSSLRSDIGHGQIAICLSADLQYACCYWAYHLVQIKSGITGFEQQIQNFLAYRSLFWFEALILLEREAEAGVIIGQVIDISRSYKVAWERRVFAAKEAAFYCSLAVNMGLWSLPYRAASYYYHGRWSPFPLSKPRLHESILLPPDQGCWVALAATAFSRFISRNKRIVAQTPLQLYSSCMLLAPQSCPIPRGVELPSWVKKRTILTNYWNKGHFLSLFFSTNGKLLASSEPGFIKVWLIESGKLWFKLPQEQFNRTYSIAFSPDNKLLACSSETSGPIEIRLWEISSRNLLLLLNVKFDTLPTRWAIKVKFLSDGTLLGLAYDESSSRFRQWVVPKVETTQLGKDGIKVYDLTLSSDLPFEKPLSDYNETSSPEQYGQSRCLRQLYNNVCGSDSNWLTLNGQKLLWCDRRVYACQNGYIAIADEDDNLILLETNMQKMDREDIPKLDTDEYLKKIEAVVPMDDTWSPEDSPIDDSDEWFMVPEQD